MEHRAEHQDHVRAVDQPGVIVLRLDQVHLGVGERAVVANGAGEGERDAGADALVKDAAGEHALLDRLADAAAAADGIDGRKVMAMAVIDRDAAHEVHAQRGAEEGLLDVMDGDGIAAEERLDVAVADKAARCSPPPV